MSIPSDQELDGLSSCCAEGSAVAVCSLSPAVTSGSSLSPFSKLSNADWARCSRSCSRWNNTVRVAVSPVEPSEPSSPTLSENSFGLQCFRLSNHDSALTPWFNGTYSMDISCLAAKASEACVARWGHPCRRGGTSCRFQYFRQAISSDCEAFEPSRSVIQRRPTSQDPLGGCCLT